jgi:hypothetical protein
MMNLIHFLKTSIGCSLETGLIFLKCVKIATKRIGVMVVAVKQHMYITVT